MTRVARFACLLVGGAVLAAAPAIAQEQNSLQQGIAARRSGHPQEAHRLLEVWLAQHPGDLDAMVQLAFADLALGNLDQAEAEFNAVLKSAPDYRDAQDGLAMIAARHASAHAASDNFVSVEGAVSDVSGESTWSEVAVDGEAEVSEAIRLGGRAAYYRRFGKSDEELVARVGIHPTGNLWLRAALGAAPDADFRPLFSTSGGFDLRVSAKTATVVTFDVDYQRFRTQVVVSFHPGLIQYFAKGRAWLTLRGIGTIANGEPLEIGGLARLDVVPARGWRLFGGASRGPDTDLGIVTRVTGVFGGIEAPLARRLSLNAALAHDDREGGLDRTEFRLGLKARF